MNRPQVLGIRKPRNNKKVHIVVKILQETHLSLPISATMYSSRMTGLHMPKNISCGIFTCSVHSIKYTYL